MKRKRASKPAGKPAAAARAPKEAPVDVKEKKQKKAPKAGKESQVQFFTWIAKRELRVFLQGPFLRNSLA